MPWNQPLRTSPRVQPVLQHHRGGGGVEARFSLAPVSLAEREPLLGFAAAEPFVLQLDRQTRARSERCRKRPHGRRLIAIGAIEPSRQPDHNAIDRFITAYFVDGVYDERHRVCCGTSPIDRPNRAGQRARGVADCETDAPITEIDPQDAHGAS